MLSPAERVRLDSLAEADKVKEFAIYFGLVMGLGVWFLIYMAIGIDWKYGILITISTASILVFIKPLQILLGKSARCLAMGVMYFAVVGFIAWLLSMFIPKIQENVQPVTIALAVVACIISLYREATGMHHASAIPREPSKPTP